MTQARLLLALLISSLMLSSCSRQTSEQPQTDDAGVVLIGTSSSSIAPAYWRWFSQLAVERNVNADLQVMGSGASMERFITGTVDFSGTDAPPSAALFQRSKREMLAFPVTARAIAVAYNHPGCALQLKREQLADIFLGKIRDFAELGCKPGRIGVLHRRSASGTTATFTATLSAFSPAWRAGPGEGLQVSWPIGRAVQGSEEMIQELKQTPGSLGYVEAAYVGTPLSMAAIASRSGRFMEPSASNARQALESVQLDQRLVGHNPDPAAGYPIVSLAWVLVPRHAGTSKAEALRTSLNYILTQPGQEDAELLGYVPLPDSILSKSRQQLDRVQP